VVYGAAKAAVIHLTKLRRMELGESGVRVIRFRLGNRHGYFRQGARSFGRWRREKTPAVMREVSMTRSRSRAPPAR